MDYLIWSNEHCAWWRQNSRGYTTVIEWAGVYGEVEAQGILQQSNLGAQTRTGSDFLGMYEAQTVPDEVLVPIPGGHPGGPDCPPARKGFAG